MSCDPHWRAGLPLADILETAIDCGIPGVHRFARRSDYDVADCPLESGRPTGKTLGDRVRVGVLDAHNGRGFFQSGPWHGRTHALMIVIALSRRFACQLIKIIIAVATDDEEA